MAAWALHFVFVGFAARATGASGPAICAAFLFPVVDAAPEARLQKRGPNAWDNFLSDPLTPLSAGGSTRLLIHAVADNTARQWLPKVRLFLHWLVDHVVPFGHREDQDRALASYLDYLCFGEQKHVSFGNVLFHGFLCLAPEMRGAMPLSARSLVSWGG